ncbi:MAG: FAD-dependent oxidoreductase [Acidobacteria bacterium]|nr:FAD-dependent oxidoreductase [Acidobacteriota bacterium]
MHAAEGFVVGPLRFKNRMVMAPLKTACAEPGGLVSDRTLRFYRQVAAGGAAMIITEPMAVRGSGREHPKQLGIDDDRFLEGLRNVVTAIHGEATLACCHLNHAGRAANPKASGGPPLAPSEAQCPASGQLAHALTVPQIENILEGYRRAACRAWWSGFDAIEVQMGHGYLVAQFLSPRTNHRTDGYGGTLEKRLRFAGEVLDAVREGMDGELPIIVRISGDEMVEGGLGPADLAPLLALVEARGVAAVHVGMGSACDAPPWYYAHMALPLEPQERAVEALAGLTRLPLIVAGRMGEPSRMERLLEGPAELIALGRPLVADPELPHKVVGDRLDEILLCGSCLQGCLFRVKQGQPIACIVNPEVGRVEPLVPASEPRRILVVGGGPAGIQAAVTLARRGHRVTLYEKEQRLGGQFALAPKAPGKGRMALPLESLIRRLGTAGVEIHTGTAVTPELVERERPDAVVLAAGAKPIELSLPGLETARVVTGTGFFETEPHVGRRVLVIGGGMIGMEAAEHLAGLGVEVTVVEMLEEIARDMEPVTRKLLMRRLDHLPITVMTSTRVEAIGPDGIDLRTGDGERMTLPPVDTIIVSVGTRPDDGLAGELRRRGVEVHVAGDADHPGQIIGAVESGWKLGSTL